VQSIAPSLGVRRPEAESPGAAELPARHSAVEDGANRLGSPDALGEAPGEDAGVACERWEFESSFERLCGSGSGLSSGEPDGAEAARSPPAQREEVAEGPLAASRLRRAVQNGWKFARKRGASGQTGHRDADGGGVDDAADLGVVRAESLSPARDQEVARMDDAAGAAGTSLPRRSFFGAGRGERRDKSAGGAGKEGNEGKKCGEAATEDVEEVVWTEDNKVPANGSKGEILIKSPGRYLLALNSKPSRFLQWPFPPWAFSILSKCSGVSIRAQRAFQRVLSLSLFVDLSQIVPWVTSSPSTLLTRCVPHSTRSRQRSAVLARTD
jgi:hypothetical protein